MDSVIGESVVPIEHQNVTKYPPERMSERLNHIEHCARSLITDLEVTQRGRPSMERETQQMEQQSLHQRVRSRPTKGPRDRRPPPPPIFHVSHVPRTLAEEESPPIGRLRCRRSPSHLSEMPRTIREGEHLKEKGQRILFLDGGGIKVKNYEIQCNSMHH